MNHKSKTKNKKIIKKRRNVTNRKLQQYQSGGVKVIIGMDPSNTEEKPIEREVLTLEQFSRIFDTARNLDIISCSSLNSFVIKLHLANDRTFFRSDMVSEAGERLDFLQIMDATSGLPITEIIVKICVVGHHSRLNDYIFNGKPIVKASIDTSEFLNEYETQRYLYSAMMSTSGNPFCPDAFGKLELKTIPSVTAVFGKILDRIHPNNEFHTIYAYLRGLLSSGYKLGLIMMESVPGNYDLFTNYLPSFPRYNPKSLENLFEIVYAINILTIYRGKLFLLDAHTNNWLCDPSMPTLLKVKAIDFGRVYRIHNEESTARFLNNVKANVARYFGRISCTIPQSMGKFISDFFTMMGLTYEERSLIQTQSQQLQIGEASNLLANNLQEIIKIFNENIFFSKPFNDLTPEERELNINMIHRLLLCLSLVDGFFNDTKFGDRDFRRSQQYESYKRLFDTNYSTPDTIISSGMLMDFQAMVGSRKHSTLSKTYETIYNIVYEYCQDRLYPDIRGYTAFKEVQRSIARQSAIKLIPYAKEAKSQLWNACCAIGESCKATGSFVSRNVITPAIQYSIVKPIEYAVVKPTMWALYSLKLKNPPPPPQRVFATSKGGRRRRIERKRTRKNKHIHK